MKIDKEFLLKNQFWIALGSAGVLILGSLGVLLLGAGPRASSARANYTEFESKLKTQKDFKNEAFKKPWDERKGEFSSRKDKVWADAYKTQDGLMTWPPDNTFFEDLEKRGHFGDEIKGDELVLYRDKLYRSQFASFETFLRASSSDDAYLPVAFDRKLLNEYSWAKDKTPTVEECWLAQEEIWLRREVFRVLQAALDSMATFKEVKELHWNAAVAAVAGVPVDALVKHSPDLSRAAYQPRKLDPNPDKSKELAKNGVKESRLFRSHDWEVNLLLEEEPKNRDRLRISASSTIKNINPSRRPLYLGSSTSEGLRLQVRQRQSTTSRGKPVYHYSLVNRIVGVLLPYGEQLEFKSASGLDSSVTPARDFELVEVFDPATSPIKRLERLEIGEAALAHRLKVGFEMNTGPLAPKPEEGQGDKEQSSSAAPGGGGGAMPGGGGAMPGGDAGKKGDLAKTPNDIPRGRYILHNEVVRRIPIAFTVVLDQDYRNEVLTAVANSPLRIQTTQAYWAHRGETAVATTGGKSNDWVGGSSFGGMSGPGSSGSRPPGGAAGPGGSQPAQQGSGQARPAQPGGTSDDAPAAAEGNRNLISLSVHGIATLYERFPPKKKDEGTKPTGQSK
ncbi:MAG: hypothetical protein HYS12_13025 [Planctomycetes bacterium]|nr:hypothetical protein [Planctomycetota bacterium]